MTSFTFYNRRHVTTDTNFIFRQIKMTIASQNKMCNYFDLLKNKTKKNQSFVSLPPLARERI